MFASQPGRRGLWFGESRGYAPPISWLEEGLDLQSHSGGSRNPQEGSASFSGGF